MFISTRAVSSQGNQFESRACLAEATRTAYLCNRKCMGKHGVDDVVSECI